MKIVWKKPDGSIAITHPVRAPRDGEDYLENIAKEAKERGAIPADWVRVECPGPMPSDRDFRDAWRVVNGTCTVDMAQAREIHRKKLRAMREPLLAKLDVDYLRAMERGAGTTEIVAAKQALRDVTEDPAIDAAATPDELKAVIPGVLR